MQREKREQRENTRRSGYTLVGSLRQFWGVMQEMSQALYKIHGAEANPGANGRDWEPLVTRMPAGDDVVMYFELPDVEVEDFDLHLHGDSLVVSGIRKDLPSLENVTVEDVASGNPGFGPVRYSSFRRPVGLPKGVEARDIEAVFGAGLLQVRVANAAGHRSRRIHIREGGCTSK